jgi:hypothetical protein
VSIYANLARLLTNSFHGWLLMHPRQVNALWEKLIRGTYI